jgi:agmatinase
MIVEPRDDPTPPFGGDEAACSLTEAGVVVLPVPYEGTVSYGIGTASGPRAILRASEQLELYDEEIAVEPFRVGIHTADPLAVDVDDPPERVAATVAGRCGELMDAGKWVMILGGEHSITPGGVRAARERHPDLRVVQLDAHADLRDRYEGSPFNHACAMARCLEVAPVVGIGIRSYSVEEARRLRGGIPGHRMIHAREMEGSGWQDRALEIVGDAPVYLTVDVDYFDPSIIPATGTPEPGGGRWRPTLGFLEQLVCSGRVVGCDVVELAPIPGLHHADFTVARLVHKLIGFAFRDRLEAI